jgi:hypothetical protein
VTIDVPTNNSSNTTRGAIGRCMMVNGNDRLMGASFCNERKKNNGDRQRMARFEDQSEYSSTAVLTIDRQSTGTVVDERLVVMCDV